MAKKEVYKTKVFNRISFVGLWIGELESSVNVIDSLKKEGIF